MPERFASRDTFEPVTEMAGSGPFRFVANDRLKGARNVPVRSARPIFMPHL